MTSNSSGISSSEEASLLSESHLNLKKNSKQFQRSVSPVNNANSLGASISFADYYEMVTKKTTEPAAPFFKIFKCDYCLKEFTYEKQLRRHRRERHTKPRIFECNECHKKFSMLGDFYQHKESHYKHEDSYDCIVKGCNAQFDWFRNYKKHLEFGHKEESKMCKLCGNFKLGSVTACMYHLMTKHYKAVDYVELGMEPALQANTILRTPCPSPSVSSSLSSSMLDEVPQMSFSSMLKDSMLAQMLGESTLQPDLENASVGAVLNTVLEPSLKKWKWDPKGSQSAHSALSEGFRFDPSILNDNVPESKSDATSEPSQLQPLDNSDWLSQIFKNVEEPLSSSGISSMLLASNEQPLQISIPQMVEPVDSLDLFQQLNSFDLLSQTTRPSSCSSSGHNSTGSLNFGTSSLLASPMACSSSPLPMNQPDTGTDPMIKLMKKIFESSETSPVNQVCLHCGIIFQDPILYGIHNLTHAPESPFKCFLCGEQFENQILFAFHLIMNKHTFE